MNKDYLPNWTMMVGQMQKPFQKMLDLNIKTLQDLKYVTLEEMSSMKQPGELLDKQVKLMMENSHVILDYVTQSFQLLEDAFLSHSKQFKENTVQSIKNSDAHLSKSRKKASKIMTKTVKSPEHKKTISIGKPIISKERPKDAKVFSKAVSDKKEDRLKTRMTKLERKMGMPEPKTGLLLNQVSIPDDSTSQLPEIQISTFEHHINHPEHPLTEQEGKGKNPFKK